MSGWRGECPPTFCPCCGQRMIHRDHRRAHESASAFGQILHEWGPRELTVGDVDLATFRRSVRSLKVLEHKQPGQGMGGPQREVLDLLDACIRECARRGLFGLAPDSGVYVVRGEVGANERGDTNFLGPQVVTRLDGTPVLQPRNWVELWNWMCSGQPWTLRRKRWR